MGYEMYFITVSIFINIFYDDYDNKLSTDKNKNVYYHLYLEYIKIPNSKYSYIPKL